MAFLRYVGMEMNHTTMTIEDPALKEIVDDVFGTPIEEVRACRQIAVENVSSYLAFPEASIPEWEFVATVAKRTGCKLLLDVNNIYVNAINHGFSAETYLAAIAPRVSKPTSKMPTASVKVATVVSFIRPRADVRLAGLLERQDVIWL